MSGDYTEAKQVSLRIAAPIFQAVKGEAEFRIAR